MSSLVTVSRTISMGHRLPSYDGICNSMHGHNVRFVCAVRVDTGFLDFKQVDAWLAYLLDDLDHAMVLYEKDPVVPLLQNISEKINEKLGYRLNQRMVLLSVEPTTEALAQLIMNELSSKCYVESVTVHETDKYQATCSACNGTTYRITS